MPPIPRSRRFVLLGIAGLLLALVGVLIFQRIRERDIILLGAALPLTGQNSQYGTVPRQAIELALEQRRKTGYPYDVAVQYEDTQLKPSLALTAVRKLIDVHHVPVIFGTAGSNETEVAGPIAQQNGVVLISPSSTASGLSSIGDYFFRTIPTDTYEATFMARFVYGRGVIRIAILAVNDTGTKSLADSFQAEFTRLGGSVAKFILVSKDSNDLRTQITSLRSVSPQAAFVVGYASETGVFLRQASELGLGLPVYSAHPAEAPEVRAIAREAAEGLVFSTPANARDSEAGRRFFDAYQARYGQDPGEFAAEAYDSAMLVLDAIAAVGPTAAAIRDYLHRVRGYQGASGEITFSLTGDVEKPFRVMIIRDGQVKPFDE